MPKLLPHWLNTILKALIALALFWALYKQLSGKVDVKSAVNTLHTLWSWNSGKYLFLVLLLMPLNWWLEAYKWQQFIPKSNRLSPFQSLLAVCAGVSFSMFTPNRTGDYLGRILLVKAKDNWDFFSATVIANICQLMVLLSFGWIGLLYFLPRQMSISWIDYKYFLIFILFGTICLFFCLISLKTVTRKLLKWRLLRKNRVQIEQYLRVISNLEWQTLLKATAIAALRYFTYASQYVLMLYFVGFEIPILLAYAGVATIFLVQSSIPLPPALGLLARGEIALLIWGLFMDDPIRILTASFGLFIINLAVPALVGLGAILNVNILKSLGYEKYDS